MDQELKERIDIQDKKIEQIYISVEKTRKYIQWTIIISVFCFVIPFIALIVIIPLFINGYTSMIGGLGL
jgi:type IV secretory pathway component VirB8